LAAGSGETASNSDERLCLTVPEAAKLLRISRGLAYELARSGQLPAVRFGRRILIPRRALQKLLDHSLNDKQLGSSQFTKTR